MRRRWADLDIEQIVDVLVQISREVALILGGSVAIGSIVGGVAGGFFLGVGAVPGLVVGGGIVQSKKNSQGWILPAALWLAGNMLLSQLLGF
ncbi:DUF6861 domain-containing protein [Pseudomonas avellanae]|uniref:DUF6861 domain-containing protein n=1 Tax=Pseudomonas avellanae TaxID=46257 RepID=UPI002F413E8D